MISLRPYQEDLRARTSAAMRAGCLRPLIVLPTGGGKTRVATYIAESSIERRFFPFWFMVHRKELVKQTAKAFYDAGLPVGIVATGFPTQGDKPVQVVLIDSLKRRLQYLDPPRVIIPDEAHHCTATKWKTVQELFPTAFYIGLTATPQRLDGKGLGAHFDQIIEGPSMRWLIDNGHLADYRIFAPPPPDFSKVGHVAGEFNRGELDEVLAKSTIVGDAIDEYRKHAPGKRALIRAVSVEASRAACEAFRAAGHKAAHLDGTTPDAERTRQFEAFARGDLSHLFNVDLFSEGVDIPGVECCIDLRPTESLVMYLQFIGRMLRPAPGKTCGVYLDHVGNTARHGLPDEPREWSLDGRKRKKKPVAVFTCKACYGTFGKPFRFCPNCGEATSVNMSARAAPQEVEGELREVTADTLLREQEELAKLKARKSIDPARRKARTLEELIAYAQSQKYKKPERWAMHLFNARQAKRA